MQAESIAEAIIRHHDLCDKGKITAVRQLLQLAPSLVGLDAVKLVFALHWSTPNVDLSEQARHLH